MCHDHLNKLSNNNLTIWQKNMSELFSVKFSGVSRYKENQCSFFMLTIWVERAFR